MSNAANRGKDAEGFVQDFLDEYDKQHARFDWRRNYDAHTAGGRFPRQTGDFEYFLPWEYGVIEVKEVKNHDCRLPHKNYTPEKVAKVRKRVLAGGKSIVLVWFRLPNVWRISGIEQYTKREGGSWDLSGLTPYPTAEAALNAWGFGEAP